MVNQRLSLYYSTFNTPVGTLSVAYSGSTVRRTDLAVSDELFERNCGDHFGQRPQREEAPPERLRLTVTHFLAGNERFKGYMDLSGRPQFQQHVLYKTMEIRRGEIRTYQWIAREVGAPRAVRAVGTALAKNPLPILIPCHRVVRADYRLGEYGCGGPDKKREILHYEGVETERLERLGRQSIRFLGSKNTRIFCLLGCYTGRRTKDQTRVYFPSKEAARAAGFRPCKFCKPA